MTTDCASAEETLASAPVRLTAVQRELPDWIGRLQAGLTACIRASGENLGHLEEQVLKQTRELSRRVLEEAAQVKADATPPRCARCGGPLTRLTRGHARTFESRFGPVTIRRARGWCRRWARSGVPGEAPRGVA